MNDASECGSQLVRVRAQVMMRDDSKGGWLPMEGGGLSNVYVRKRPIHYGIDKNKYEYVICGYRLSDQSVILSCIIKKDFEYNKVMPTFHHWKTGEKKYGLTFLTAADGRAFDKGLRTAVDELLEGISEPPSIGPKPQTEAEDDDVFMTLNLPAEQGSRSSSDASAHDSRFAQPLKQPQREELIIRAPLASEHDSPIQADVRGYPYVEETRIVEFDPSGSLKKRSLDVNLPLPRDSGVLGRRKCDRQRCRYCQEYYLEEDNRKGSCEYAPDCVRMAVDGLTCIRCARGMLYHCMADAEGDFAQHPCECDDDEGCGRRWQGVALLSLLVPCLWLYPPLRACHWCGIRCGLWGGRHRPVC